MTENERVILTLVSREGPLSKREMAEKGGMSWATAVKMVGRLVEAGILVQGGTSPRPSAGRKNAYVYDLAEANPLAIGIDVEYYTTTVLLSDLRNRVLVQETTATPHHPTDRGLIAFLQHTAESFVRRRLPPGGVLAGIGIGIPHWLVRFRVENFEEFGCTLSRTLGVPAVVENTVRNYTIYKKWAGAALSYPSFIVITIRSGVGTGIFLDGRLLRGEQGLAGELGHLPMLADGPACRCGKAGCLETLVNQRALFRAYRSEVLGHAGGQGVAVSDEQLLSGLAELFTRASRGEAASAAVVRRAAGYLGRGIASLLMVLNIRRVAVCANFGPDGGSLLPPLEAAVREQVLPGTEVLLSYVPIEKIAFAQGASLLILKDFLALPGEAQRSRGAGGHDARPGAAGQARSP
jgi:predicted NBD/HSP70 family sugar kinase